MVQAPRIVVEVLSPGTETTDRRRKLRDYLACPTIEEYLLVLATYEDDEEGFSELEEEQDDEAE